MASFKFQKTLNTEYGFVDTRCFDLGFAIEQLHKAVCFMDGQQRRLFWATIENCGVEQLLKDFARDEGLNDQIGAKD